MDKSDISKENLLRRRTAHPACGAQCDSIKRRHSFSGVVANNPVTLGYVARPVLFDIMSPLTCLALFLMQQHRHPNSPIFFKASVSRRWASMTMSHLRVMPVKFAIKVFRSCTVHLQHLPFFPFSNHVGQTVGHS